MTPAADGAPVVVSIQSQLVYGCAGNSAAVPVLHAAGAEVYAVPTVLLSNTPHYPTIGGGALPASMVSEVLQGLLDRVAPERIAAVLTGYIGTPETAAAAARFIDRVREAHPALAVLCDPVMGDLDLGMFVAPEVAAALCETLVPRADLLTPNLYEARHILGDETATGEDCARALRGRGASVAVVTGIPGPGADRVSTLGATGDGAWCVTTPLLDVRPTGTGDVFSAAFLCAWLRTRRVAPALEQGVSLVFALLERCRARAARELDVTRVPSSQCGADPAFRAEPVAADPAPAAGR